MCPKCKDYIGRCGKCGADLAKATHSEPIGKPVLPPRPSPLKGDNPPKASASPEPEYEGDGGFEQSWRDMFEDGR